MLMTLIQKEMMHHILSARFVALLLMCLLLVPLTLHINYSNHRQNLVDYQEAIKRANIEEAEVDLTSSLDPEEEVSKVFLKPTPLSVFANGLENVLPSYLGMTRNGITQGPDALIASPLSYLLGHLDFLFVIGTVFSLLALLFTFDAVAGEREAGTLRITLANALPRDVFLWSKLIGGYLVFVVPFLVSFIFGLLMIVWQGFPLGESDIFPRVLGLILVSLLYIAVFFAIGTVISIYLDSAKTALIIAFTVWVFAVLITPRVGFLAAKLIAPTRTPQSVYMEKAAMQEDFNAVLKKERDKIQLEGDEVTDEMGRRMTVVVPGMGKNREKIAARMGPLEEEYRLKFQNHSDKLDRDYKRETKRQEQIGETLSRMTPTSSLIYLATNLTQTGKGKRSDYLQAGDRHWDRLDTDVFSKISDHIPSEHYNPPVKVPQPAVLKETTLGETFRRSVVDALLLCFFAVVLTTVAFLKFFRTDI